MSIGCLPVRSLCLRGLIPSALRTACAVQIIASSSSLVSCKRFEVTESLKLATRAVAAHIERPDVRMLRNALAELSTRITALTDAASQEPHTEHLGARACTKACAMMERGAHKLREAEALESELRVSLPSAQNARSPMRCCR